ncbi:TolC family protein [Mariprofundus sp. EBB-1]|uniref:TolC family protein n=1 Tax=Mariprofundus sp. EBB-1 TaxID=2650971 RepID=UPI000EF18462|nr:TolC family protein [Mariprofundus sp. EBB-1]RLL51732.1 TolC family protein [Mariprofundus sp. EBB-1]
MLLCIHPFYSHAQSLQEAMDSAAKQHPMLQMAEQQVDIDKGNLEEQGAYAYNPEISLEPQRRRLNSGGTSNDYYVTLSQGIETGGKRGFREQSAQAALNAANQSRESTRQQLMVEAARSYVAHYFAGQAFELRRQQSDMLKKVSHAVEKKLALGESSQLDANLAQSAFASALNATTAARRVLTQTKQRYLTALGKTQVAGNIPQLLLPALDTAWQPPADAYEVALLSRPDLAALRAKQMQFGAQADLASAARIPDITFSAMSGREAGEQLIKLGISVPLPVLNSHRGAYRAALAEKERVSTGLKWSEQQLSYAVQSTLDNHANAMASLSGMIKTDMQQRAKDTISLAQKAYDAGELDLEELVVHIRQGLDARMTALEIIHQGWLSRIRLAEVFGHPEYIIKGTQS